MPKFRVGYNYEISGFVTIEADDEQNAQETIWERIEDEGIDSLSPYCPQITHRDYKITDIEEV